MGVIAANSLMINTPIVIANRTGCECSKDNMIKFWGSSFVTNSNGDIDFINKNNKLMSYITIDLSKKSLSKQIWGFCQKN